MSLIYNPTRDLTANQRPVGIGMPSTFRCAICHADKPGEEKRRPYKLMPSLVVCAPCAPKKGQKQ